MSEREEEKGRRPAAAGFSADYAAVTGEGKGVPGGEKRGEETTADIALLSLVASEGRVLRKRRRRARFVRFAVFPYRVNNEERGGEEKKRGGDKKRIGS